jgi:hypothetical protein
LKKSASGILQFIFEAADLFPVFRRANAAALLAESRQGDTVNIGLLEGCLL